MNFILCHLRHKRDFSQRRTLRLRQWLLEVFVSLLFTDFKDPSTATNIMNQWERRESNDVAFNSKYALQEKCMEEIEICRNSISLHDWKTILWHEIRQLPRKGMKETRQEVNDTDACKIILLSGQTETQKKMRKRSIKQYHQDYLDGLRVTLTSSSPSLPDSFTGRQKTWQGWCNKTCVGRKRDRKSLTFTILKKEISLQKRTRSVIKFK